MRTSVPGRVEPVQQRGFSLLEVVIVLCIIGIVSTAASLALVSGNTTRQLQYDAQRLTRLFALAQTQARAWGQPIAWHFDERGYRFTPLAPTDQLVAPGQRVQPAKPSGPFQSGALRERAWLSDSAVYVRLSPAGTAVFTADWFSGPFVIELSDGAATVRIGRSGIGVFQVLP